MKRLKQNKGFTLVESVLVIGLLGIFLVLLSGSYLSVYKNYIKASQKANNLEEARLVVNYITDNFRKYEAGSCKVWVRETETELLDGREGTVKKIVFKEKHGSIHSDTIAYSKENKKITFEGNEISSHINDFIVRRNGQLYDFVIEVGQDSNAAMSEQVIKVGTTVILQYTNNLSD